MVVLVLLIIAALQASSSYNLTFGSLQRYIPGTLYRQVSPAWLGLRFLLIVVTIVLWLLNRKRALFRAIVITNGVLTFGLLVNMVALMAVLAGLSSKSVESLLVDVFLMAVTKILIFSIWYWIIDPPGVE